MDEESIKVLIWTMCFSYQLFLFSVHSDLAGLSSTVVQLWFNCCSTVVQLLYCYSTVVQSAPLQQAASQKNNSHFLLSMLLLLLVASQVCQCPHAPLFLHDWPGKSPFSCALKFAVSFINCLLYQSFKQTHFVMNLQLDQVSSS